MQLSSVTVIGISGPSGSGKSTLANRLASQLLHTPSSSTSRSTRMSVVVETISMDNYYKPITEIPADPTWGLNFESVEGIDVDRFMQDVVACVRRLSSVPMEEGKDVDDATQAFLILEGFLLFYFAQVAEMCSVRVFLDADQDVCRKRRYHRGQDVEDNEAFRVYDAFKEFYDGFVWAHYARYRSQQWQNIHNAPYGRVPCVLDATIKSPDELCAEAMVAIASVVTAQGNPS